MPKSCLDGYLTTACATCPDWADWSDGRGIGCATHYPISLCEHFAKMEGEETASRRKCKYCSHYNKVTKKCEVTDKHTPRKSVCSQFSYIYK